MTTPESPHPPPAVEQERLTASDRPPVTDDDRLRAALTTAHRDDQAPPFRRLWPTRQPARWRPWALATGVAAVALALTLVGLPRSGVTPPLAALDAGGIPATQPAAPTMLALGDVTMPTDFLLESPSRSLLSSLPSLGQSITDKMVVSPETATKGTDQ